MVDSWLLLDFWCGLDVLFVGWTGASSDFAGEDLLKALGGGYGFDGFEVLELLVL